MDISDKIALAAVAISIITAIFSGLFTWKANKNSKEANDKADEANRLSNKANEISSKSISIDYDATFNAFFIQVKKSYEDVSDLKSDTNVVKGQPKEFTITKIKYIEETFRVFPSQDMKKRPSKYANHYIWLAEVSLDIQTECNIIQKIIRESEENYPENIESFMSRRITVVEYIDEILGYLKKIIDENEQI